MSKIAIEAALTDGCKCDKCTNDAAWLVIEVVEVGIGTLKTKEQKVLCTTCKDAEFEV